MSYLTQDLVFWRLVHHLAANHQFRLLNVNETQQEVWLEPGKDNGYGVIRLKRQDIDWGNWVKQDTLKGFAKMEEVRKALHKRSVKGLNVYFSMYAPVDDWEYMKEQAETDNRFSKVEMDTVLLTNDEILQGLKRLFDDLNLSLPSDIDDWFNGDPFDVEQIKLKLKAAQQKKIKEERNLFLYGKPLITYVFVAVNLLMFLLLELNGGSTNTITLLEFGAKYNPLILEGEWWRFFTPVFLHIGFLHLFMNTLALYYLGSAVERIYGSIRFFIIYMIAGLFGSFASFAFNDEISAGASGAIFGCFGALLYFGVNHKELFFRTMGMNVIVVLIINLIFGFSVPMVDNGAHLGGLAGGFLASGFVHLPRHKQSFRQLLLLAATIAAIFFLLYYGFTYQDKSPDPALSGQIAHELIEDGDLTGAKKFLKQALDAEEGAPAEVYFLMAYVEIKETQFDDAIEHLQTAIEQKPDFHEAYYNLSLVYIERREYEKAKDALEKALEYAPDNQDYQNVLERLEKQQD